MISKTGDQLAESTGSITTRESFCQFLELLLANQKAYPEEWENADLTAFIGALSGFAKDMHGYYQNFEIDVDCEQASWRLFADMLLAARVYE